MNRFSADRPLFIGIDGGGSGCRARIADGEGRMLGVGTAAPAAVRLGLESALGSVKQAAHAAVSDAGLPTDSIAAMHAVVGLAGVGRRKGALESLRTRPHPFRSVDYVSDAVIACIGAHAGRDGGVVIAGTGSVGLALMNGREIRVGGYGFPISDEGSGADVGLRAVRCALRASDGRIQATDLTRALMARFNDDPSEVVAWADRANATDYAKLAPLVMEHAEQGDEVACAIVHHASAEIDIFARALAAYGDALDGALALARQSYFRPQPTLEMQGK